MNEFCCLIEARGERKSPEYRLLIVLDVMGSAADAMLHAVAWKENIPHDFIHLLHMVCMYLGELERFGQENTSYWRSKRILVGIVAGFV